MEPLELEGRLLWADGVSSVTPDMVTGFAVKFGSKGKLDKLAVTEMTPELESYNNFADIQIKVKTGVDWSLFPPNWALPERYKYLDLDAYLLDLADRIEQDELYEKRIERLVHEIYLFKKLQLDDVLRALIYVIEHLEEKDQVWGVGRGSSCSSYLLYLLGLHEVDAVKYEIDITDFIREGT